MQSAESGCWKLQICTLEQGLLYTETACTRSEERLQSLNGKLDLFLASVEKPAFRMADIALRNPDDALDVVQEAMIKLVEKYSDKPDREWKPLFYRILQSRITDHHRKRTLQKRFFSWIATDSDDAVEDSAIEAFGPPELLVEQYTWDQLVAGLQALPLRQQQVFLLRTWQGLSVEETATIMRCSAGSVKTHLSRATHALKKLIGIDDENQS